MCAIHVHLRDEAEEEKAREVADTSCVFQLTALEKCCNITKVVVGKVKYILRTFYVRVYLHTNAKNVFY